MPFLGGREAWALVILEKGWAQPPRGALQAELGPPAGLEKPEPPRCALEAELELQ